MSAFDQIKESLEPSDNSSNALNNESEKEEQRPFVNNKTRMAKKMLKGKLIELQKQIELRTDQ